MQHRQSSEERQQLVERSEEIKATLSALVKRKNNQFMLSAIYCAVLLPACSAESGREELHIFIVRGSFPKTVIGYEKQKRFLIKMRALSKTLRQTRDILICQHWIEESVNYTRKINAISILPGDDF